MQKKIFIAILVIGVCALTLQYVYYGSFQAHCIYSGREMVVPRELSEGLVELTNQYAALIVIGANNEYKCLPLFNKIDGELRGAADQQMHAPKEEHNLNIPEGSKYKVVQVIEVKKHGINTVDSGGGPIYYLVLDDGNGHRYDISTAGLGINESDQFLKFTLGTSSMILKPQYFPMYVKTPSEFYFTPSFTAK